MKTENKLVDLSRVITSYHIFIIYVLSHSEYVPSNELHSKQVIPAVMTVGSDHINERGIYEEIDR